MQLMDVRKALRKQIAEQMQSLSDRLTSGRVASHPEYCGYVGRIMGLRAAMDLIDETFNKLLDEGDDE